MTDITELVYQRVKAVMSTWDEADIYAISFFVESNEAYHYQQFENVTAFYISYNTEADCVVGEKAGSLLGLLFGKKSEPRAAGPYDEERWNFAFWRQDLTAIIDPDAPDAVTDALFRWYAENGIENIGYEDDDCYDDNGYYIGKGPVGEYELVQIVTEVAKRLRAEGFVEEQFGKPLPIIIHDLDYSWYDLEATKQANPNGEADDFFQWAKMSGMMP